MCDCKIPFCINPKFVCDVEDYKVDIREIDTLYICKDFRQT